MEPLTLPGLKAPASIAIERAIILDALTVALRILANWFYLRGKIDP